MCATRASRPSVAGLITSSSGIVTNAAIRPQGYDPVRDLQAITVLTATPTITWTQIRDLFLMGLGYTLPFTVAAYFILKNREVAA